MSDLGDIARHAGPAFPRSLKPSGWHGVDPLGEAHRDGYGADHRYPTQRSAPRRSGPLKKWNLKLICVRAPKYRNENQRDRPQPIQIVHHWRYRVQPRSRRGSGSHNNAKGSRAHRIIDRIRDELKAGRGIHRSAKLIAVGVGSVQKVRAELRTSHSPPCQPDW
jgi:hypothetical protein